MKTLFYFVLAIFSGNVWADQVTSMSELALLPPYCRGTQQIRTISKDPKPLEEYYAMYGMSYSHFHHYCWALNTENNAWKARDSDMRKSKLGYALGDLQYSLDRSDRNFLFLPDIYNTKARLLFALRRDAEAMIALQKAIEIKPDFVTAIARLSDYYTDHGDKARAIKTLEEGIDNSEKPGSLIKKLKKLGKTYQGAPGSARKKETPPAAIPPLTTEADPKANTVSPLNSEPASSSADVPAVPGNTSQPVVSPVDAPKPPNPYCRFCP